MECRFTLWDWKLTTVLPPPPPTPLLLSVTFTCYSCYLRCILRFWCSCQSYLTQTKVELYHSVVYSQLERRWGFCLCVPLPCVHYNILIFFLLYVHYKTGEPGSLCNGSITNGSFEGFNSTKDGTYHVESARGFSSKDNSPGYVFLPPWK